MVIHIKEVILMANTPTMKNQVGKVGDILSKDSGKNKPQMARVTLKGSDYRNK